MSRNSRDERFKRRRVLLDKLYRKFNKPGFIHPDPLEFVYCYDRKEDQEIVGLIAACLAYGRVAQILKSVRLALGPLGPAPRDFLVGSTRRQLNLKYTGFKHRWTSGTDLVDLLWAVRQSISAHGSLEAMFRQGMAPEDNDVLPALSKWVGELRRAGGGDAIALLSEPGAGSACKRLLLYLRWMIRADDVDPGLWRGMLPSKLVIPLDAHMYRLGKALGLTTRRQPDMKTAMEITQGLKLYCPRDPVRYDFALTRAGMRGEDEELLKQWFN